MFQDKYSRDEVKKKVFAWLYNPNSKNKNFIMIKESEGLTLINKESEKKDYEEKRSKSIGIH